MFQQGVSRLVIALGMAAMAAGVAACGGPSSNNPTAPTSSAAGATISGTVVGLSAASQLRAQRVSAGVTTTGATSAAIVDDSGHFTLTNVTAGQVDLHFMGTGVDAHLILDNVAAHSTVAITVRVNANDAHLEDEQVEANEGGVELTGGITAGSLTGSCAAHNLAFTIGTTKVTTSASTRFTDGTCEALKDGSRVEVKGARQSDNSVLATSVEGDAEGDEDQQGEVELSGIIAAGSLGGTCPSSLSFKIGTTLVTTNALTRFEDTSCGSLAVGDSVEVRGTRQTDASVLASRVERNH
jgi:uncharacterized protein DUF5666